MTQEHLYKDFLQWNKNMKKKQQQLIIMNEVKEHK